MIPTALRSEGREGDLRRRPGPRARAGSAAVVGALLALCPSGCTVGGADADAPRTPSAPGAPTGAPSAGQYPVATPQPQVTSVPVVTAGGYQLVSAGNPVEVRLPGVDLLVQVSGPDVDLPDPTPGVPLTGESAPGVLTVSMTATDGSTVVDPASFLGLDEEQEPEDLQPDTAPVTVDVGHPATLHLASQFETGHTTLTWQPLGQPLVTWDFVVEID